MLIYRETDPLKTWADLCNIKIQLTQEIGFAPKLVAWLDVYFERIGSKPELYKMVN
jgi:hypothetical protein